MDMKRTELVSIDEQMYRRGIWARPQVGVYAKHKGIRIISEDGVGYKTKIVDGETGEMIPGIYKAEWSCEAGGLAKVVLYAHLAAIDAATENVSLGR